MFSDMYVSPFVLDGRTWNSVEHYRQALKFRMKESYYELFSSKSNSKLSKDPLRARKKGYLEKQSKLKTNINNKLLVLALFAKFTQNDELKRVLLATNNAELYFVDKNTQEIKLWSDLIKVRNCITALDGKYDLSDI